MSVINKMLRDLDDRQASGTLQVRLQDGREGIARDTQSIRVDAPGDNSSQAQARTVGWLVALGVLTMVGGGLWWWSQNRAAPMGKPTVQAPNAVQAVVPPLAQTVTTAAPPMAAKASAAAKASSKPVLPRPAPEAPAAAAPSRSAAPPVPTTAQPVIPATVARNLGSLPPSAPEPSLKMDSAGRVGAGSGGGSGAAPSNVAKASTPALSPVPVPSATATAPVAPAPRPSPVMEALAQAQALWTAGSRAGAIELLRDAIAVAERSSGPGSVANLAALAREYARMELSEGRATAALDMLTRLEPGLSGVADIWALRGNAAQRLGRHEESANAYLMALKLKPGEPRWMLGAAVSLAAQGQTGAAAEWAEQARAAGALSREVATYLQQLGVPLRER